MPSVTSAPSADQQANRRARADTGASESHAHMAYAAYASTPSGSVIALLMTQPSAMPGSSTTGPNPVSLPSPTQPDQMETNAPAAMISSGHRGTRWTRAGVTVSAAPLIRLSPSI
jgi:hypothetical protein